MEGRPFGFKELPLNLGFVDSPVELPPGVCWYCWPIMSGDMAAGLILAGPVGSMLIGKTKTSYSGGYATYSLDDRSDT